MSKSNQAISALTNSSPGPDPDVTPDDVELLKKLIAAANGNVIEGPGLEDLVPVKAMIASGVDLDDRPRRSVSVCTNAPPAPSRAVPTDFSRSASPPILVLANDVARA